MPIVRSDLCRSVCLDMIMQKCLANVTQIFLSLVSTQAFVLFSFLHHFPSIYNAELDMKTILTT